MASKKEHLSTSAGRTYELLGGPFKGNNGTFYVLKDWHDDEIILMHANQVESLRKNNCK